MKELIEKYLERGFGSMNKNDFEVAIFHNVMQDAGYCGLTDYDLSRKLRIPESKVKRLRYEAELKYGNPDYRAKFLGFLKKAKFYEDSNKVQFIIPDKSVREYLNAIFVQNGIVCDTSHNTDILIISVDDLTKTLEGMFSKKEIAEIVERAKKLNISNKSMSEPLTFSGVVKSVISGVVEGLTSVGITALFNL